MNIEKNSEKIDSYVCDFLRFPLTVMVVFLHLPALETNIQGGGNFIKEIIGWVGGIAVPVFFIISGYYFFYHAETFTLSVYKSKLEKRIKSLIIPYVVWTILALVFVFSFVVGGVIIHNKSTDVIWVWIAESIKLQVFYSSASMISYDNFKLVWQSPSFGCSLSSAILVCARFDFYGFGQSINILCYKEDEFYNYNIFYAVVYKWFKFTDVRVDFNLFIFLFLRSIFGYK